MENIEQKQDNNKAKKRIAIFLGVLALIGVSYGAYWFAYGSKFEDTENAYVNANQITVSSSVSGSITGLYVNDTMQVKKDFIAIKVEDTDYKIALERAENDLAKAVRNYKGLSLNEEQANKNVLLRKSEYQKSLIDFNREKNSLNSGLISQEEFENYQFKYEQAKLNLDNALVNVKSADNQAFATSVKDHPDVSKAITQYKQAYIDLARTDIKIPEDGIVAKKAVNIGQKISPNQSLFTVIDEKNEWVDANLKESQLQNLKMGQEVVLKSDVNKKEYKGYIVAIGAGSGSALSLLPAQNATGNWIKVVQRVPVKIVLDKDMLEKNGYLPIGTSMRVDIDTRNVKAINYQIKQEMSPIYNEKQLDQKINEIIQQNLGK